MSRSWAGGSTRRWRELRAFVLERDGHVCKVPRADGLLCGARATHADHIVSLADGGPKWDPNNLRAACAPCNLSRGTAARAAGPTVKVVVVIGPPGAGKSTRVRHEAVHGDVVIDLDAIAAALTPGPMLEAGHAYPQHVRHVAIGARAAALRRAVALGADTRARVYVVHAVPTVAQLRAYVADGWQVDVIDPGPDVVRARVESSDRQLRHFAAVDQWYIRKPALLDVLEQRTSDTWDW